MTEEKSGDDSTQSRGKRHGKEKRKKRITTRKSAPVQAATEHNRAENEADAARTATVQKGKRELTEAELAQLIIKAAEYDQLLEQTRRIKADFENYRKRMESEKANWRISHYAELLLKLLPIFDNLERATVADGENLSCDALLQGVKMISDEFEKRLNELGIFPFDAVGEKFDPRLHEALLVEETDQFEDGTVIAQTERGYRIGDRIIRPARVKVARNTGDSDASQLSSDK